MAEIKYLVGDATQPKQVKGTKSVIVHCCNNLGAWGAGFVVPLGKRYPQAKESYAKFIRDYKELKGRRDDLLGRIDIVPINDDLDVINLIGQEGIYSRGNTPPIRYGAIADGFHKIIKYYENVGEKITIHMPRIGCGLAGGRWDIMEEVIEGAFTRLGIDVYVYDLPKKEKEVRL